MLSTIEEQEEKMHESIGQIFSEEDVEKIKECSRTALDGERRTKQQNSMTD